MERTKRQRPISGGLLLGLVRTPIHLVPVGLEVVGFVLHPKALDGDDPDGGQQVEEIL
jgi:hypothetical protein